MSKLTENILGTFTNKPDTGSARKWTAFNFVVMVDIIHVVILGYVLWGKDADKIKLGFSLMEVVFYVDCAMILLLLGLVTFEQIVQFKNGKKESPNNDGGA